MLAGNRTADRDTESKDLFAGSLSPFQVALLPRIERQNRMHVPVARVENVADRYVVLPADLPNCLQGFRDLRAGNDAVLYVIRGADTADRSEGILTTLPKQVALFR